MNAEFKAGEETFNIDVVLDRLEAAAIRGSAGDRTFMRLVKRLVRVQQQRIIELSARIQFLERDSLIADREHQQRRQELATLQDHHDDMSRRLDSIMQRTR